MLSQARAPKSLQALVIEVEDVRKEQAPTIISHIEKLLSPSANASSTCSLITTGTLGQVGKIEFRCIDSGHYNRQKVVAWGTLEVVGRQKSVSALVGVEVAVEVAVWKVMSDENGECYLLIKGLVNIADLNCFAELGYLRKRYRKIIE
jgi:hypothetical protein